MSELRAEQKPLEIRAAVLRCKGGPLTIESLLMDRPGEDEVLVRLVASGICHTDIDLCDQWSPGDDPVVLGHEGAGVVEAVGGRVRGVKCGDPVILSYQSCGRCDRCRNGRPTQCVHFWDANFGFARLDGSNALWRSGVRGHFFGQSSFASHALVTEQNLVKVSKDIPLKLLAPLGCGIQTGAATVLNALAVAPGQSVAVIGTGAVGLAAVMAARLAGADPIIGIDIVPERLALAQQFGATHTLDSRQQDPASHIARITGHGVDYAVETSGNPEMHRLAKKMLNPQGTAALVAGGGAQEMLPEGRKALGIIQGDAVPQHFIPRLIEFYQAGEFPVDRLVKFYDFNDINQAIDDARRGTAIKPVVLFAAAD